MKDMCVWMVVVSQVFFGTCYIFRIRAKKANPTISTWIIFLVGCALSFLTYIVAEDRDIKSGIFNATDLAYVMAILIAAILWGRRECVTEEDKREEAVRKAFERWYLAGAGAIVVYGLATGNAWNSNVLTQVLMTFAYFPMWHKMITQKRNTESFLGWLPVPAVFALYPAFYEGNALSAIYALRALILCLATLALMSYYSYKASRRQIR